MAGPGPITNRGIPESNHVDEAAQAPASAAAPPSTSTVSNDPTNTTESFPANDWYAAPSYQRPPEDAAATSRAQLEREHAGAIADRSAIRDALAGPLKKLAKDDPSGSRLLHSDSPGVGQFQNALSSAAVATALGHLPREAVKDLVMNDVRKAWPKASQEEVEQITTTLMKDIGAGLTDRSAYALRDAAVRRLDATAEKLTTLAKDPAALKAFTDNLGALESGTPADRASATELRASLGLTDVNLNDSKAVAKSLADQADFLRDQGRELHGKNSIDLVMRTVKDMGLEDELRAKADIKPGSWADASLKQVKIKGEASQQTIDNLETGLKATIMLAMPLTGATGLVMTATDMGLEAAHQARVIGEKREHGAWVTAASASGIGHTGTVTEAQAHARHALAVAAVEIAASGLAAHGAGHVATHLAHGGAAKVLAEKTGEAFGVAAELAAEKIGEVAGKAAVAGGAAALE